MLSVEDTKMHLRAFAIAQKRLPEIRSRAMRVSMTSPPPERFFLFGVKTFTLPIDPRIRNG